MVKIFLVRHAQSELNLLKDETFKKYGLSQDEEGLCLAYKIVKNETIVDAYITELGKAQCQIANLKNKEKFQNVIQFD